MWYISIHMAKINEILENMIFMQI